MKKALFIFLLSAGVFSFSQTNRFIYELDYRTDSTTDYRKSLMALDVDQIEVKFYDYDFIEYDSINKAGRSARSRFSTKTDQVVTRQLNSNRHKWYRDFFDYFVIETTDDLSWNLKPEMQIYQGYQLQKATTEFGGRIWTAWFAKEINISEGPYKFRDLPGLIVLLEDADKNFVYKLVKNKKLARTYDTTEFLETHYGKAAVPITLLKFNKYIQDIYTDPTRMFADQIKSGEKTNFKNENIETLQELHRKKSMLQKGIKSRYLYIEKNTAPNFKNPK